MSLDKTKKILSDIIVHMKYAKHIDELKRRETWEELVNRNREMHLDKYPQLKEEIDDVYDNFVLTKKVLPSMRSFQFAGKPISINNARIYNCSFLPIDHPDAFSEIMFLLLGGSGVGYSVQTQDVDKLPEVKGPKELRGNQRPKRYLVNDSIEGWADSIKMLVESYFYGKMPLDFDFRDIRPKGARLITSGGKAPGPQPLRECIVEITNVFENAIQERGKGTKLKPIEAHDITCYLADAVLAGGIRRAALISLFTKEDNEMLTSKFGSWWELNPQRGRANNSAVVLRSEIDKEEFQNFMKRVEDSKSGEPGIFFTNDKNIGTNPCCEISLKPFGFCNLTEINGSDVESQQDLDERAIAATFLGTLQAGYTNFHYLRDIWRETAEEESLLGVSMTGTGSGVVTNYDLAQASALTVNENIRVANLIGINPAKRITCGKPSGTTSLVLGTSSGVHAWHNDYYIRRIRVGKNEAIYKYLATFHPELIEDEIFRPDSTAVISVPQKAPESAILRTESALELLDRVKLMHEKWITPGHVEGVNTHNQSVTVSVKDDEWDEVTEWMWENRSSYQGIALLPYDGGTYQQAPFEDIKDTYYVDYKNEEGDLKVGKVFTDIKQIDNLIHKKNVSIEHIEFKSKEEIFRELAEKLEEVDLTHVIEEDDETNLMGELACSGGACEVT